MKRYFIIIAAVITTIMMACVDTKKDGKNVQEGDELIESNDTAQSADSLLEDSFNQANTAENLNSDNDVNFSPRGEKQKVTPNNNFVLNDKGVDLVQVGADISTLPDKVEGLYDKKKTVSYGSDGNAILLYAKNDQIMEVAYDERNNKITQVRLTTPTIKTEDGVHQFMKYNSLLKIDRFNKIVGKKNPNDVFDITLDGITYELDENIRGEKYVSAIVVKK